MLMPTVTKMYLILARRMIVTDALRDPKILKTGFSVDMSYVTDFLQADITIKDVTFEFFCIIDSQMVSNRLLTDSQLLIPRYHILFFLLTYISRTLWRACMK